MAKVLLNLVEMHNISVKITLFCTSGGSKCTPSPTVVQRQGPFAIFDCFFYLLCRFVNPLVRESTHKTHYLAAFTIK